MKNCKAKVYWHGQNEQCFNLQTEIFKYKENINEQTKLAQSCKFPLAASIMQPQKSAQISEPLGSKDLLVSTLFQPFQLSGCHNPADDKAVHVLYTWLNTELKKKCRKLISKPISRTVWRTAIDTGIGITLAVLQQESHCFLRMTSLPAMLIKKRKRNQGTVCQL